MPPLPGGGKPYYGSVREEYHRRGTIIQGTNKGSGGKQRVQRDDVSRLPVESSDDSTWEVGGSTTPVDHPGRGKGSPGIPDILYRKGGTEDLPRGGVPRESGDKDVNAGALLAPEFPRHRGDAGGRKLPPPTVRPVQHAGPLEGAERAAPEDRTVPQGRGKEETAADRDGDEGELRAGV